MRLRVLLAIVISAVLFSCSRGETQNEAADASEAAGLPNDSLCLSDCVAVEREIAGMIARFPQCDETAVRRSIAQLLGKADGDPAAMSLVTGIMERYLNEPNSPMRSEDYYIVYLEELLRLPGLPEAERLRPAAELEMARKNRPGSVATDFAYIDRKGRARTLHTTPGRRLLLIFYDPECWHCSEILAKVGESPVLSDCIAQGRLRVLAVYTEGNRRLWEDTKASMPQQWAVGFDTDSIVGRELYSVPAMPVMYLLDSNKRVVLKDAFLPEIEEMLTVMP